MEAMQDLTCARVIVDHVASTIMSARQRVSWRSWMLTAFLLVTGLLRADQTASLAWKASPDPRTTGYVLLYGNASGAYTTSTDVGNVTQTTVTGLVEGLTYYFAVYAYGDAALQSDLSNEVAYQVPSVARVISRLVFYNGSAWDNFDPAATASDAAIAIDKTALLPGQVATINNYTSYSRGLNGVMVDIANLGQAVSISDFGFRVGNDNNPDAWPTAPSPSISVRPGAGVEGSDRITFIWPDNAIQGEWLQVTIQATSNTRLPRPDVFYFGNAIGDTGNSTSSATVTAVDALRVLHEVGLTPVPITDPLDFNRDQLITSSDALISLNNLVIGLSALQLIDLSGATSSSLSALDAEGITQLAGAQLATTSHAPLTSFLGAHLEILGVTTLANRSIKVVIRYQGNEPVRVWKSTNLSPLDWRELPAESITVLGNGFYEIRMPLAEAGSRGFFRLGSRLAAR
jgi:hypothetical protein